MGAQHPSHESHKGTWITPAILHVCSVDTLMMGGWVT